MRIFFFSTSVLLIRYFLTVFPVFPEGLEVSSKLFWVFHLSLSCSFVFLICLFSCQEQLPLELISQLSQWEVGRVQAASDFCDSVIKRRFSLVQASFIAFWENLTDERSQHLDPIDSKDLLQHFWRWLPTINKFYF